MRPFVSGFRSLVVVALAAPATGHAQGLIRGTVTDSLGVTLGYSVVSVLPEDRRVLTDDVGRFVMPGLAPGPCVRPGPPDPDTDLSLAIIFGELRENADRAIALGAQFPFVFRMERRMLQQMPDGEMRPMGVDTTVIDGSARWTYRRGEVIAIINDHGKPARQLNIPGLVQLADSGFHNAHCFTYGGVERIKRRPYIRVDFAPDRLIDTPDIEGSVYLDPDRYQISRIVMSLTHPERLDAQINELTVTSSFREIVSSIAILDSAEGVTTFEMPRGSLMVRTERQKTVNVVFLRAVPPGAALH